MRACQMQQFPAGSGNIAGPDNVMITDGPEPEFAVNSLAIGGPPGCSEANTSVNIGTAGLITYSTSLRSPRCLAVFTDATVRLTSDAFSRCKLTAVASTFPITPVSCGVQQLSQNVKGTLQSNTVNLTAEVLGFPRVDTAYTAIWQLSDCPAVSLRSSAATLDEGITQQLSQHT